MLYTIPREKNIVVSYGLITDLAENNFHHLCNTDKGSSGCPILLLDTFKVIGVHFGGSHFNFNIGTFIKYAIDAFNNKYNVNINILEFLVKTLLKII